MSDFSLFSLFTAGLACMVPFVSAYTQPVGAEPEVRRVQTSETFSSKLTCYRATPSLSLA